MLCMMRNTDPSNSRLTYISLLLYARLERQCSKLVKEPLGSALVANEYGTSEDGIRPA